MLDRPVLRSRAILPLAVRALNPVTQGIAIQRADICTYRTDDWMLSTAQAYHPGEFGDQQHIWQATLPGGVTVFSTHPGAAAFDDNDRNFSPSYWVGNGVLPHAVQHRNVTLCIHDLRVRRGFMERGRRRFSHAYFPVSKFDECLVDETRAFGRKGDSYVALSAGAPLRRNPDDQDELIQDGAVTWWACELGSRSADGGFGDFVAAVRGRRSSFDGRTLRYDAGRRLSLRWKGDFTVDGRIVDTCYGRYDTPWVKAGRCPESISVVHGGHRLDLDFSTLERTAT